ncbi:beta-ketoacyl synthase domain-containing protein [Trichoderma barbatum]
MTSVTGNEPIAIIGSGCRFPGRASSPSKLWDLLQEPRDVLQTIPKIRFNPDGFYHEDPQHPGRSNVQKAYLLDENLRHFDAQFFNIKGVEASAIDPQHRMLLETTYEALEAAGLTIESLRGSDTAVYLGLMYNDYELLQYRDLQSIPIYHETGTARSIASNRISYFYDWHGPSITLDTACSSSLVAVHMAVQALRSGETKIALAGGTNLIIGPEHFITESNLKMLSSDGQSRMWDDSVNGYGRGEGVAAIVLKTLSSALVDGDPILGVIRETGVNHDGKKSGITMPSADAQTALIKQTYAKAGLDINSKADRCQYFEAHGTGTPAGDPIEAEAVHNAFFGPEKSAASESDPLWIGSIKSIIGHTESTAGIAGVLKVCLAMKNGQIPPNLHFNNLNPRIKPYYGPMQIPTELRPWPKLAPGQPRRASVNSFGFGGTNSHIILESFEEPSRKALPSPTVNSPFLFSAHTKQSLEDNLAELATYLEKNPGVNAADLAYTLRKKRSQLPLRVALSATTVKELRQELTQTVTPETATPKSGDLNILGIFTGQGAQYMRMGAELLEGGDDQSRVVENILAELDQSLATLPVADRPKWKIRDEILSSEDANRMNEATLAQPLCTAIQIVLVQLLRKAKVRFTSVVGHSSGEIAAAYAAGRLSAHDAIRVAYYRGLYGKLAGSSGKMGSMMAVGLSWDDASDLCEEPQFEGRIMVAANNAPTSVTLTGDADAIQEMKVILEEEDVFHTELKVDKAYHSHHMKPCSEPYLEALSTSGIKALGANDDCLWFSSVHPNKPPNTQSQIDGTYWIDNLVSPVMFMDAVEAAINSADFDAILEVGPHPALKRPVLSTFEEVSQASEPVYVATLQRKTSARKSFSAALGHLWARLGDSIIDIDAYERSTQQNPSFQIVPDLPTYKWSHSREYWHESHISRNQRLRCHASHPLLGELSSESSSHQLSWRNTLKIENLPWIKDHQVQSSVIFPAAGFVATAIETIPFIVKDTSYSMIEVEDFSILQPMIFGNENEMSVLVTINGIDRQQSELITAHFAYSSWHESSSHLRLLATGKLNIFLGEPMNDILPELGISKFNNMPVDPDLFYEIAEAVGYGYTGFFRALSGTERKHRQASGDVVIPDDKFNNKAYVIHPASLDASLQVMLLAKSYPGDGEIRSLYLPSSIRKIRINPKWCGSHWIAGEKTSVQCILTDSPSFGAIEGDITIMEHGQNFTAIQLEGVALKPLKRHTAEDDRQLFSAVDWVVGNPDLTLLPERPVSDEIRNKTNIMERTAAFYLSQLMKQYPPDHAVRKENEHYRRYLRWADIIVDKVIQGNHAYVKPNQMPVKWEDAVASYKQFADYPVFKLFDSAAHFMPKAISGKASMVEKLVSTPEWVEYYEVSVGPKEAAEQMGDAVAQIVNRYPHSKMLEVGAGTGGATKMIFNRIGRNFASYDYTDISAGFFVVASLVIHATGNVENTLRKLRMLLKPGGYLVMVEAINPEAIYPTFIFGCLEGWWFEGREMGAPIPIDEWHEMLLNAGYSGVDSSTPDDENLVFPYQVLVSQAIDDKMMFIRKPLSLPGSLFQGNHAIEDLIIIGGTTDRVRQLGEQIKGLLKGCCGSITTFQSLETIDTTKVTTKSTVLLLEELDNPVFKELTSKRFEMIKHLLTSKKDVLWVTENRLTNNPYANMIIGLERSISWEVPDLRVRFVDFEDFREPSAKLLAEAVLRLHVAEPWMLEDNGIKPLTWTVETETIYKATGNTVLPRMRRLPEVNDRLNSVLRTVTKHVDPNKSAVTFTESGKDVFLREIQGNTSYSKSDQGRIQLRLTHSSPYAIRSKFGFLYVVLGNSVNDGSRFLGFTASPASIVNAPMNSLKPCTISAGDENILIGIVTSQLLATAILYGTDKGDSILVHEATPLLVTILDAEAKRKNIGITYTTSSKFNATNLGWTHVNQWLSRSQLKRLLPRNVAKFVDLGSAGESHKTSIRATLDSRFIYEDVDSLLQMPSGEPDENNAMKASSLLEVALLTYESVKSQVTTAIEKIPLNQISSQHRRPPLSAIVEWPNTASCEVAVRPLEVRLRSDRTYWLCGLTGSLGLSTADWMISKGARHVVLSSRNPKIDPAWLQAAEAKGVNIRVAACDVSNFNSLQRLYQDITTTMPNIAGVAQGAMVLKDMSIWDASFEDAKSVFGPKVDGSINVDRLFHHHPLDFLIFFSSTTTALGNPGQALYSASNQFLSGLVRQRRLRGMAASSMGIAIVLGVGYVTEQLDSIAMSRMKKRGFDVLSEVEFHQFLAEAIINSPAQASGAMEIWSGLNLTFNQLDARLPWHSNPQFGFLIGSGDSTVQTSARGTSAVSIKQQLSRANTIQAVKKLLFDTMTQEMRSLLELSGEQELKLTTRTDELGVDSLVAVKLRTWLSSNYEVSIPTLEILGGTSLDQLMQKVMKALPENLVSNITNTASSSDQDTSANATTGSSASGTTETDDSDTTSNSDMASSLDDKDGKRKLPERFPVVGTAPISFTQTMFWFVHALLLDKSSLNSTWCFQMNGNLRKNDLARAVQVLAQRHESLRTCFELTEDQGVIQGVLETSSLFLECYDIDSAEEIKDYFDILNTHEFDLNYGSLIRIMLLTRSPTEHYLLIGYHHIIFDGASHVPLMHELDRAYNWEPSTHKVMQFADFSNKQFSLYKDGSWDGKLAFWREQFKTVPEVLPIHRSRVAKRQLLSVYDSSIREGYDLEPDLHEKLRAFARANRTTTLHIYLAAFKILLFRFLGVTDVCIGLADDGRRGDGLQHVIGPFLNILPIRMTAKPTETFARAAQTARDKTIAALENSEVPLEAIFNELRLKRSPTHSPLFQTFLNYLPFGVQGVETFCGCQLELQESIVSPAQLPFDITLTILHSPKRIQVFFSTQSHLYTREDCSVLLHGYQDILKEFATTPKAKIGSEFRFRQEDLDKAVTTGRAPTFESRFKETLPHYLELLVPKFGNKQALIDDCGNSRSYKGLIDRVSSICEHMLMLGIRPGARIAVFQQPSISWLESMLSILKLGAIYFPLVPSTPLERLSLIVRDAQPAAILVHAATAGLVDGLEASSDTKIIDVCKLSDTPTKTIPTYASAEAPAIVLYTSGSTGTPKGVQLTHNNLKYAFDRTMHDQGPKHDDIVLHQTAYSFDLSIMQIFMALSVGATLCVATEETRQDARLIVKLLKEKNITITLATPTEYKGWLRRENWPLLRNSALKVAMSSGEAVTESLVRLFQEADILDLVLYNSYGLTETSCASSGAVIPSTYKLR